MVFPRQGCLPRCFVLLAEVRQTSFYFEAWKCGRPRFILSRLCRTLSGLDFAGSVRLAAGLELALAQPDLQRVFAGGGSFRAALDGLAAAVWSGMRSACAAEVQQVPESQLNGDAKSRHTPTISARVIFPHPSGNFRTTAVVKFYLLPPSAMHLWRSQLRAPASLKDSDAQLHQAAGAGGRSCPGLCGFEVNRTVMPLHNLIGLGQPDSAAAFLGGEIQFKNLVLCVRRNAARPGREFR